MKILSKRKTIILKISKIKKNENIPILQKKRIDGIIDKRKEFSKKLKLNPLFIEKLFREIINESMRIESKIIKRKR